MGDKKWAESGSQPDWMDVCASMRALDGIHLGKTMVTIFPEGIGSSGGTRIVISTCWEQVPGGTEDAAFLTERVWVGHRDETLPAFILGGLYAHDFALGERYQQRKMEG
jgi:hypothetical protein